MTDLTGKRFGMLTVICEAEPRINGKQRIRYWKCKCDCGNEVEVRGTSLTTKKRPTKSCGCLFEKSKQANKVNLVGERFGKLTVVKEYEERNSKRQQRKWVCVCDCGEAVVCKTSDLTTGKRTMCEKETELGRKEKVRQKALDRYQNLRIKTFTSTGFREISLFDVLVVNDLYYQNKNKEIPYIIYKITDTETGKVYIGKTQNFRRRICQHLKAKGRNILAVNRAMFEKGVDKFRIEAIDFAYTAYEAKSKEFEWIERFKGNSFNVADRHSYNNIPVNQISPEGKVIATYESIAEAEAKTGISNIRTALDEKDRKRGGFTWETA